MRPACARLKTRHPLKTDSYIKKCRPVYVCMCTVANCDSEPFLFFFLLWKKRKVKKEKNKQKSALAFFFYFQVISRGLYSIAEMITSSCLLWSLDVVLYFSTVFFFFFIAFSLFIRFCVDDVQSFVDDVLSLVFPPPSQMFDFSAENRFRFYYSRAPAHNTHWYQCLHKHIQLYLVLFVSSSDVCIILYLSNLRRLKKKFCLLLSLNLVYMILCISPIESLLPFHRIRSGFLFLSSTWSRVNQLFTDGLGLSPLFSVIFFFQRRMINTDYYTIKKETKCEGQICRPPFSFSFLSVGRRSR